MTIIGIGYRARTGKDEIARYLETCHRFRRRALADALKDAAAAIFHLSREQLYGTEKEAIDTFWRQSPRHILQKLGTECLRQGYDQDVWIQSLRRYMLAHPDQRDWVIPDVRFPNEARAIKEWGGTLWLVKRPGVESVGIAGHASETSMDGYRDWDEVIVNDGTLEDLRNKVDDVL